MVTAVAAGVLSLLAMSDPAAARSHHGGHHAVGEPAKTRESIAAAPVPLPQPRPAEAPARASAASGKGKDEAGKSEGKDEDKTEAAGPPPPSACRLALTEDVAIAPSVPPIHGPGECGGDDLVRLEAVVLPDKKRVTLTPAATMRCTMATEIANWVRSDVVPEVAKLGSAITALDNFDSYECRGRNGKTGAPLSEHGRANAIDVHGFKLADGRMIELTDRTQPREVRESLLHSACTRFTTVLGPDSDGYHEDHIHLDLLQRHNNYRICQWDVLDPMPKVAPLLPAERPEEAPPRAVAEAGQGGNGAKAKVDDQAKSDKADAGNGKAKAESGRTGQDKARAQDQKPVHDAAQGPQPAPDAGAEKAAPRSKRAPSASSAELATGSTDGNDKSPNKPSAGSRSKAAADPERQEKASPDHASERASAEKADQGKTSRRKLAAQRSTPRKHRHRARMWNPFASFF
ncbi:extensin family protein [Bradyrhizobium sp. HKCCYLS1011]|uniref:extensin family protein n=1 Tax=Bradyrhizobium sp. HKCCYLS1011 TaxID=3420733 RepID=UPI003EBF4AC3